MNRYIVVLRVAGVPPVGVTAQKFTRGAQYVSFYDDHGNETAWFNTCEIAGMWIVNDSPLVNGMPKTSLMGRAQ